MSVPYEFYFCLNLRLFFTDNQLNYITHKEITTFTFMLNFVLVLGSHFKAFMVEASLPLDSIAQFFLGLATEGIYRIIVSFLNSITGEI